MRGARALPIAVTRGDGVTATFLVSKTLVLGSNPSPLACGAVDKLVKELNCEKHQQ